MDKTKNTSNKQESKAVISTELKNKLNIPTLNKKNIEKISDSEYKITVENIQKKVNNIYNIAPGNNVADKLQENYNKNKQLFNKLVQTRSDIQKKFLNDNKAEINKNPLTFVKNVYGPQDNIQQKDFFKELNLKEKEPSVNKDYPKFVQENKSSIDYKQKLMEKSNLLSKENPAITNILQIIKNNPNKYPKISSYIQNNKFKKLDKNGMRDVQQTLKLDQFSNEIQLLSNDIKNL